MMLNYLKKFTLDILPSVFATIIGAYIVNHYIIPAATPKNPAAAVAAVDPAVATTKADAPADKDNFAKGVAEKASIEKAAEKAAEKSDTAPADSRKRHLPAPAKAAKAAPAQTETTASVPAPAAEERRDANDLARAAIERLRGTNEPPRTVATAAPQVSPQQVSPQPAPIQPGPVVTPPPAMSAAQQVPPAPEVFNVGTGAIPSAARPLPSPALTRSAEATRPLPPANIPGAPPVELHADIEQPNRITTVADDVVSAAKSVFHAVIPR